MASPEVPPRRDGMHPGPAAPPADALGVGGRPKATWTWWEALAVYVVSFLVAGVATLPILTLLDEDENLANITSTAVAAIVVVAVLVAWLSNSHPLWRQIMGFPDRGTWWREIRTSIGFGLLLYPAIAIVVYVILRVVLQVLTGEAVHIPEQVPLQRSVLVTTITILYAIVIAPIHEELFFRGILFRGVRDRYGLVPGLLATGVGFGLIHYLDVPWQNAVFLMSVMVFTGVALGLWYERRGTIVASMLAHMVFNIIGIAFLLTR